MGFTHHWERETELGQEAFARAIADCQRITTKLAIPLAGIDGSSTPIFRPDAIAFNGQGAGACEPFEIHQAEFDRTGKKRFIQFVKTNHAPYDLCVRTCLICLKHQLGDAITIMSDANETEWQEARQVCHETLGYGMNFQLNK